MNNVWRPYVAGALTSSSHTGLRTPPYAVARYLRTSACSFSCPATIRLLNSLWSHGQILLIRVCWFQADPPGIRNCWSTSLRMVAPASRYVAPAKQRSSSRCNSVKAWLWRARVLPGQSPSTPRCGNRSVGRAASVRSGQCGWNRTQSARFCGWLGPQETWWQQRDPGLPLSMQEVPKDAARFLQSRHDSEARLTRFDFSRPAFNHPPSALPSQSPDPSQ